MKPYITIITLGVEDLQRSTDFYEKGNNSMDNRDRLIYD